MTGSLRLEDTVAIACQALRVRRIERLYYIDRPRCSEVEPPDYATGYPGAAGCADDEPEPCTACVQRRAANDIRETLRPALYRERRRLRRMVDRHLPASS